MGCTRLIRRAACTLPPTVTRFGVALGGGGGALPAPPITPPSTPPEDPPATPPGTPPTMPAPISGSASSLICFSSFGMAFGATSFPASIKCATGLWITCTTAGGGGGGGGGGGAKRIEDISVLGNASV